MRNMTMPEEFLRQGGSEFAPMSTTKKLEVALEYASSAQSVLLKLRTKGFMQRGADLGYLSCFPGEEEVLYPPLTFLR